MTAHKQVLKLVAEYQIEEKKTQRVPHYYERNGKILERLYPDYIYTKRYTELRSMIEEQKIFRCCECGEMCSYFDLEYWICNFDDIEDGIICGCCYEDGMGEDL